MRKLFFVFPLLLTAARHEGPEAKQEFRVLPRFFEANRGQAPPVVRYLTREPGYTAFFLDGAVSFVFPQLRPAPAEPPMSLRPPRHAEALEDKVLRFRWLGGRAARPAEGDPRSSVSNYYIGRDSRQWRVGVPHFGSVRYSGIYEGIDLTFNRPERRLAFQFHVAPGGNPSRIQLAVDGRKRLDAEGNLLIESAGGTVRMTRPRAWQGGAAVGCRFALADGGELSFVLGGFDPKRELLIDPAIEYLTYLGGNTYDSAASVAVDTEGAAYITGYLQSPQHPVLDAFEQVTGSTQDVFLAKFAKEGNRLLFYTYLGGSYMDAGTQVAVDPAFNVYVAGWTASPNFSTRNPAQANFGGGYENAFLAKLTSQGKLTYATYLGGGTQERPSSLVVDETGAMYIAGTTHSPDFPAKNALQSRGSSRPDGFLAKLAPDGSRFLFATYFGGLGSDYIQGLSLDGEKRIYFSGYSSSLDLPTTEGVTQPGNLSRGGTSGFAAKLSPAADRILACTYLGGAATAGMFSLKLDRGGSVWMLGNGGPDSLTVRNPLQGRNAGMTDAILMRLTGDLRELQFSTWFGGSDNDYARWGLAVDTDGAVIASGFTYSPDFPLLHSLTPFRGAETGYKADIFALKLAPGGNPLIYSTLIGGNGVDMADTIALDAQGAVYLAGTTGSFDLPVKSPLQREYAGGGQDIVLVKLAAERAGAPAPPFAISPLTVPFERVMGEAEPAPQSIRLTAVAGGVLAFAASVSYESVGGWLAATPEAGSTPGNMQLSVKSAGLAPGSYRASVAVNAGGALQTAPVTLKVFAAAPRVTALEPAVIPARSEETVVQVKGEGFVPGAAVQIATSPLPTVYVDARTLRVTLSRAILTNEISFPLVVVNPQSKPSAGLIMTIGQPLPQVPYDGVAHGASYQPRTVSPGMLVTIFGVRIGPEELAAAAIGADGRLANELAETRVLFDGVPAPLVYVSGRQTSAIVPFAIAGRATVDVQVEYRGQRSPAQALQVREAAPGVFTADASGRGLAAALNEDGTVNSTARPAARGSVAVLYASGVGLLEPPMADGEIGGAVLSRPRLPVKAYVDGIESEVLYAGSAPGLAAGIVQVNLRVPESAANGEVVLRVGEMESQAGVFLALKE